MARPPGRSESSGRRRRASSGRPPPAGTIESGTRRRPVGEAVAPGARAGTHHLGIRRRPRITCSALGRPRGWARREATSRRRTLWWRNNDATGPSGQYIKRSNGRRDWRRQSRCRTVLRARNDTSRVDQTSQRQPQQRRCRAVKRARQSLGVVYAATDSKRNRQDDTEPTIYPWGRFGRIGRGDIQ